MASDGARIQNVVSLVKVHGPFTTMAESAEENLLDYHKATFIPNHRYRNETLLFSL